MGKYCPHRIASIFQKNLIENDRDVILNALINISDDIIEKYPPERFEDESDEEYNDNCNFVLGIRRVQQALECVEEKCGKYYACFNIQ